MSTEKKAQDLVVAAKQQGMSDGEVYQMLESGKRQIQGQHKASEGGCAGCDEMATRVRQLEQRLGPTQGGTYHRGDRGQYTTAGRSDVQSAKGGVVRMETAIMTAGATAGIEDTVSPPDDTAQGRMEGQQVCSFFCFPAAGLDAELGNIQLTLRKLNTTIHQAQTIPLAMVSDTADGEIQRYRTRGLYIQSGDVLSIDFEVTETLGTAEDQIVQTFVELGDRCD